MSTDRVDRSSLSVARSDTPFRDIAGLAVLVSLALMVAAIAGLSTAAAAGGWYASAEKTLWNPPNQVFAPVWSVLYTLMAFSAWLVWRKPGHPERSKALALYGGQLALNAGWPPVFFLLYDVIGGAGLWLALGWILVLDFAVMAAIILFWRQSRIAGLLLLPYWTWLLFATALNASLAVMNG